MFFMLYRPILTIKSYIGVLWTFKNLLCPFECILSRRFIQIPIWLYLEWYFLHQKVAKLVETLKISYHCLNRRILYESSYSHFSIRWICRKREYWCFLWGFLMKNYMWSPWKKWTSLWCTKDQHIVRKNVSSHSRKLKNCQNYGLSERAILVRRISDQVILITNTTQFSWNLFDKKSVFTNHVLSTIEVFPMTTLKNNLLFHFSDPTRLHI